MVRRSAVRNHSGRWPVIHGGTVARTTAWFDKSSPWLRPRVLPRNICPQYRRKNTRRLHRRPVIELRRSGIAALCCPVLRWCLIRKKTDSIRFRTACHVSEVSIKRNKNVMSPQNKNIINAKMSVSMLLSKMSSCRSHKRCSKVKLLILCKMVSRSFYPIYQNECFLLKIHETCVTTYLYVCILRSFFGPVA